MLQALKRFAFGLISIDEIVHALVRDRLAACQDQRLDVETHTDFDQ